MPDNNSDNNNDVDGYAAAADLYWQAGWRGILPLRRGHKKSPPPGFTGRAGETPSYADIMSWADLYPDGNICLRLPDGIIGVDVDAYGAKNGADTLTEAENRWGRLPATARTTSRDDGISGIRLYRTPPGIVLAEGIAFPDLVLGDIEIIQRHHRYAIVWPSLHPEGATYQWINPDGTTTTGAVPAADSLPELPTPWVEALRAENRPTLNDNAETFPTRGALTAGSPSEAVAARLRQAIKELNLPGQSRHDTCRGHVLALMRLGRRGEPGVEAALKALGEMFIALVSAQRPGGRDEALREYRSMVVGPGASRELSQPDLDDWTRNIHIDPDTVTGPPADPPAPAAAGDAGEPVAVDEPPHCHLEEIERGFWDTRDSLKAIYTTALARMASPWAVLAHCAARALTQVRPNVTLPPIIGGPGSLNWFAAISARSGGGKGAAGAAAELLIPDHVERRNIGSGEGLVAAFAGDRGDPDSSREAIMILVDEVDSLTALQGRSGSTMMPVIRSAFSGEQLGHAYADKDKRRTVAAHTYRMTLIVSVQPERAAGLMSDAGGGTPQRFMWFPGTDPRVTADPPWPAGPLELPPPSSWMYPREIAVPAEARELILAERVKVMRGETGAIDTHSLFVREKFAYALAVLDGRVEMSVEDWELAGIAADVSIYTRELILDDLKAASRRDASERGTVRGVEMDAADVEREQQRAERARRILRWVMRQLDEAGADGMTWRDMSRAITSRDRPFLRDVLGIGARDGLIGQVDGTTRWVKL